MIGKGEILGNLVGDLLGKHCIYGLLLGEMGIYIRGGGGNRDMQNSY